MDVVRLPQSQVHRRHLLHYLAGVLFILVVLMLQKFVERWYRIFVEWDPGILFLRVI